METVVRDQIDHTIIGELLVDGRVSYADLGKVVGLSPHATADRIRRLMRAGIITGFSATICYSAIGRPLDAIINVRLSPTTDPDEFEKIASQLIPVRELTVVTGRFDYLVRVGCKDTDDLDATVRALRRDAGAAGTETHIVMRSRSLVRPGCPHTGPAALPGDSDDGEQIPGGDA